MSPGRRSQTVHSSSVTHIPAALHHCVSTIVCCRVYRTANELHSADDLHEVAESFVVLTAAASVSGIRKNFVDVNSCRSGLNPPVSSSVITVLIERAALPFSQNALFEIPFSKSHGF